MGIGRTEEQFVDDDPKPQLLIKKITEPVVVATKKLYQTDPKGLFEILVTILFLVAAFFIRHWGFYLAFTVWILVYSNAQEAGYQLYLKIKKQKKWAKTKTKARQPT